MNTLDIKSILSSNKGGMSDLFAGVFARDKFIDNFSDKRQKFFVFNTHPSGKSGEHWLGVTVDAQNIHFFDSYALDPSTAYPDIFNVLSTGTKTLTWNSKRLQGTFSTVCGDYCLLFGLLWSRVWKQESFYRKLTLIENKEERDHLVREIIVDLFKKDIESNFSQSSWHKGIQGVHIEGFNLD